MIDLQKHLPGRLGNPSQTLVNDPRTDPRIAAAVQAIGDFGGGTPVPSADASYEECLAYCDAFEVAGSAAHPEMLAALPSFDTVQQSTEVIAGQDGNEITLYIHQPRAAEGPTACVIHTHGGGMVLARAADPNYILWRNSLAEAGVVVVGVEFRNGGGSLGNHPYPAGLNDCVSALRWVTENRRQLGVSHLVLSGESGGGNLALATALRAHREGWSEQIAGVYAQCPYISGTYADPPTELLSLRENDGYMLSCQMMAALVRVYDPTGEQADNPLAWPLQAGVDELRGLPPHAIAVNELDPLRDEGLAYFRRLLAAGVPSICRTINGTPHGGDQAFVAVTPELYADSVRSVVGFAKSLVA